MALLTDRLTIRLEPEELAELVLLARSHRRPIAEEARVAVGLHLEAERARQSQEGREGRAWVAGPRPTRLSRSGRSSACSASSSATAAARSSAASAAGASPRAEPRPVDHVASSPRPGRRLFAQTTAPQRWRARPRGHRPWRRSTTTSADHARNSSGASVRTGSAETTAFTRKEHSWNTAPGLLLLVPSDTERTWCWRTSEPQDGPERSQGPWGLAQLV